MSDARNRGVVVKKHRALLDGSNLYRRLDVRLDSGETIRAKVDRATWQALSVGDTVIGTAEGTFRKA
jgi:hypothetical protein